jgi:diguanylate cyclase (GGDEF)-like protein/PAS domain S-box-containing protein
LEELKSESEFSTIANSRENNRSDTASETKTLPNLAERLVELEKINEQLRKREQTLADFFENSVIGLHWVGADGTILWANQAELKLLGYTREEYIGHHVAEFHVDRHVIEDILQKLSAKETLHDYEARLRCKDGSIKYVSIDSNAFFKGDRFIHTRCFTRDITARKQAQKALHQREQEIGTLADIGLALTQNNPLQEILQQCAEALVRHLDAAFARIWTLNSQENVLELQASAGMYTHIDGSHSRIPVGQYKIGLIAQECRPHLSNHVIGDPRVHDQAWAAREGMVAFAGYPLTLEQQVVGVMAIFSRKPLSEHTLKAMASVANGIGLGIQRKRAESELKQARDELEMRVRDRTIELAKANQELQKEIVDRQQAEIFLRQSQRQLAILIDSLPGIVFSRVNDSQWSPRYLSEGCLNLTEYSSEELVRDGLTSYNGITHPEDLAKILATINDAIAQKKSYVVEYRIQTKSGQQKWLWEKGKGVFASNGEVFSLEGFITDITERKQAEEALLDSESKLRLALAGAKMGTWDLNLQSYEFSYSERLKQIFGLPANVERPNYKDFLSVVHPRDREIIHQAFTRAIEGDKSEGIEFRILQRDGTTRWVWSKGQDQFDEQGNAIRTIGVAMDITERKQSEDRLLHDALHDPLTDLPNRTLFLDRLERAIHRVKRYSGFSFAVLFLDLDRFKIVNDSLGHVAGDRLLMAVAQKLQARLRMGDTVARLGGDEFVILLENLRDFNDATRAAERIQQDLSAPFDLDGNEVFMSVSIGIALSHGVDEQPDSFLRNADIAMYRAKSLGKARYAIYTPGMHEQARSRLRLETDLRRAIERQELQLYYQPIVLLATSQIVGFEALVRWHHPKQGLLSPGAFISLAEETGLIVPLGRWVLYEACRQLRQWQLQLSSPLTVSVNISAKQFGQSDLIEQVQQILQETQLNPGSLKLEITESVLMDNSETATSMLLQLKALGVQLYMDDFGTGYSSLSYLHRFPVDVLKIDRSFINLMGKSSEGDLEGIPIVQTILTLAQNLGMNVIAEGVEKTEQLAQLQKLKCIYGQGYLFSPPLASQSAESLIL